MDNTHTSTHFTKSFKERCKKDGYCPTLGYAALSGFESLKQLFAALAIITLSCLSVWLSYRLGELLNAGSDVFEHYPIMLASMSLIGFYLAGYLALKGVSNSAKFVAGVWLFLLVSLDLFAAWTIMCAADHARTENADTAKIEQLHANISRQTEKVTYWDEQAKLTTLFKSRYSKNAESAAEARDAYQSELDSITQETFTSARAVFYKTPILRDDPEYWMTFFRLYIAAVSVLTIFVCPALIVIDLNARRDQGKPQASPTPDPSTKKIHSPSLSVPANNVYGISKSSTPSTSPSPSPYYRPHASGERARQELATYEEKLPDDLEDQITDFDELYEVVERLVRLERVKPSQPAIKRLGIGSDKATALQREMRNRGVLVKNEVGHHQLVDEMRLTA